MTQPSLAPTRAVLGNGAVILTRRTRTTPAVTINIGIRAGSVCDPADAPGAMYLLSKVIDRGTTARSGDDIAEALDGRGISLGISVTRHLFSFICTCLADDFDEVLMDLALSKAKVARASLSARAVPACTGRRLER